MKENTKNLGDYGFVEVAVEDGMNSAAYTRTCSGHRSDCCTRTCTKSIDELVGSANEWELFLQVEGGQVQY